MDKESLVKFNGFLAPKAEGSYLILNEGGYQIEGQTDTWKVIDEKNVQEQRFVQLVCEQTKKQKPDIVLHDSGVLVAQTIYGFDSSVMKKIEKFLREQKPELLHHQKFLENGTAERAKESGTEQNYNMIDGQINNTPTAAELEEKAKAGGQISLAEYAEALKAEKKQADQQAQLDAVAQTVSILVIDKGRMKLKDAGLPDIVLENTPKYLRRSKVPVVKAKVGPKIMTLMCDAQVYPLIPVKKEVKATISGIYITAVKGVRGPLDVPEKKKGFFARLRNK